MNVRLVKCSVVAVFAWVGVCLLAATAFSQQAASEPQIVTRTITAAGESYPPLKHLLTRPYFDRKPGNAATFYYRAILLLSDKEDESNQWSKWRDMPLADLPAKEVREWLAKHQSVLGELRTATSREFCQWDFRSHELRGAEPLSFLLPEVDGLRRLSKLVQIQARLAIAEGHIEAALSSIRDGYQIAFDAAESPFLISALVSVAIIQAMNETVLDLATATDAPNLYWAITALPNPPVNFRRAFESEMNLPFQILPILRNTELATRTPDEWRKQAVDAALLLRTTVGESAGKNDSFSAAFKDFASAAMIAATVVSAGETAKQQLRAAGWDAKRIEGISPEQAIAIQTEREIRFAYQEFFKTLLIPYATAPNAARDLEKRLRAEGYLTVPMSQRGALPVVPLLLPSLVAIRDVTAAADRDLAALRLVEVLRLHAAANKNQFPASLDEIKAAPVPLNPATGAAFPYRVENGIATIDVQAIGTKPARRLVLAIK